LKRALFALAAVIAIGAASLIGWRALGEEPRRQGSLGQPTAVAGFEELNSARIQIPPLTTKVLQLACPAGKAPLSGGSWLTVIGSKHLVLKESYPDWSKQGYERWVLRYRNDDPLAVADLTPRVVCVTRTPGMFVKAGASAAVPAAGKVGTSVVCGDGLLLGGGASTAGSGGLIAVDSHPFGGEWRVRYRNADALTAGTVTPYAICSGNQVSGWTVKRSPISFIRGHQTGDAQASCDVSQRPIAGGGDVSDSYESEAVLQTSGSHYVDWNVYYRNAGLGVNFNVYAAAICANVTSN
jgi:hypothetical protein